MLGNSPRSPGRRSPGSRRQHGRPSSDDTWIEDQLGTFVRINSKSMGRYVTATVERYRLEQGQVLFVAGYKKASEKRFKELTREQLLEAQRRHTAYELDGLHGSHSTAAQLEQTVQRLEQQIAILQSSQDGLKIGFSHDMHHRSMEEPPAASPTLLPGSFSPYDAGMHDERHDRLHSGGHSSPHGTPHSSPSLSLQSGRNQSLAGGARETGGGAWVRPSPERHHLATIDRGFPDAGSNRQHGTRRSTRSPSSAGAAKPQTGGGMWPRPSPVGCDLATIEHAFPSTEMEPEPEKDSEASQTPSTISD